MGIGIKIFMNRGRFCKRLFCWVFIIHTTIKWKHSFCFRTSFHSRCVSFENCKRLDRNYTQKRENCFAILISVAIFISVCNFLYQFAILTFWYSSYVDVCHFHMSLQFSYEFAIFISVCNSHVTIPALTYIALHGFYVTMT